MKSIYIIFTSFITAALTAPPSSRPRGVNLLQKRVCTPPDNIHVYDIGPPPTVILGCLVEAGCEYCCADGVVPLVNNTPYAPVPPYVNTTNRCHLHIDPETGPESCTLPEEIPGLAWHCDDEHDDDDH
ncbi:hypothetical protein TWF730_008129 [Orbilia blumenaviensis]|uniref:Uncharacterized protein n=1 Tax=Orbilia blumenaviensis TaxID=1796055 RepID=A0AAV9VGD7_9PEZI